jgi:Spy/CpxP family protein refolding chaperone
MKHNQVQKFMQQQAGVPPIVPFVMRQMLNQLDLTRDQRKASNKILMESADTLRVLRRETDFSLDRMQDDIDKILTPDQRVKLGKLKDEQRAKLKDQREAVQNFLKQRSDAEAAPPPPAVPASSGDTQPSPPAAATQTQPAPAH